MKETIRNWFRLLLSKDFSAIRGKEENGEKPLGIKEETISFISSESNVSASASITTYITGQILADIILADALRKRRFLCSSIIYEVAYDRNCGTKIFIFEMLKVSKFDIKLISFDIHLISI